MTRSGRRSVRSVVAITVIVGVASSLVGCANLGPVTPVAVADINSVTGTWEGIVYLPRSEPGSERNDVTLTIGDDGSFEVVSKKMLGASRGTGRIVISDGRLVFEGARGLHGVGTVLRNPAGDVLMTIEGTLADNSHLSATLWPTH
jgi:hypothetical protein